MSEFPTNFTPPLVTIHPWSLESLGVDFVSQGLYFSSASFLSNTYPLAALAVFVPFSITNTITVKKMFVYNGVTVSSSFDVGIYTITGHRIVSSGSTSQSTASAIQELDISDTIIGPGTYYLAISASTATMTFYVASTTNLTSSKVYGIATAAASYPLPSSVTFATATTNKIPMVGLSTRDVI